MHREGNCRPLGSASARTQPGTAPCRKGTETGGWWHYADQLVGRGPCQGPGHRPPSQDQESTSHPRNHLCHQHPHGPHPPQSCSPGLGPRLSHPYPALPSCALQRLSCGFWLVACVISLLPCDPVCHCNMVPPVCSAQGRAGRSQLLGHPGRQAGWSSALPYSLGKEPRWGRHLPKCTLEQVKARAVCLWAPVLRIRTSVSSVQGHSPSSGQGPPCAVGHPVSPQHTGGVPRLVSGGSLPPYSPSPQGRLSSISVANLILSHPCLIPPVASCCLDEGEPPISGSWVAGTPTGFRQRRSGGHQRVGEPGGEPRGCPEARSGGREGTEEDPKQEADGTKAGMSPRAHLTRHRLLEPSVWNSQ